MTQDQAREIAVRHGYKLRGKAAFKDWGFVSRCSLPGSPWLRFLRRIGKQGYSVSAFDRKQDSLDLSQ